MRLVKYFLVGGASAAADICIFACGVYLLRLPYLFCGVVGFFVATLLNYVLSVRFVFSSGVRFRRRTEVALVFFVSAVGLLINQATLYLAIEKITIEPILAKLAATGIVFFWNYLTRAYFVFVSPNNAGYESEN